jgi:predicted patatin/cPLA2 family phospholipase
MTASSGNGSLPDLLGSDRSCALVVQGGGMRGVYSASVLAELHRVGHGDRFEAIYATSAGALNAAVLLSGQAPLGLGIYFDELSGLRFINPLRPRCLLDLDHLIDDVFTHRVPVDLGAVERSRTLLRIGMTDTATGQLTWADNRGAWPLLECLRATAAMPVAYGREVQILGRSYVDGGLVSSVPLAAAIADGHKDILVVLTRPLTHVQVPLGVLGQWLVRFGCAARRHSRAVLAGLLSGDDLPAVLSTISDHSATGLNISVIAPTGPIVSRFSTSRRALLMTAELAASDARSALAEPPPVDAPAAAGLFGEAPYRLRFGT